jgi:transcriptional regulator with XRE-family HTH domain
LNAFQKTSQNLPPPTLALGSGSSHGGKPMSGKKWTDGAKDARKVVIAKARAVKAKYSGPHPIDIYVGNRVRMRRVELGMSQAEMGDEFAITFQQIHNYEKGTTRIGASRLQHFATRLGVPVAYFFDNIPAEIVNGDRSRITTAIENDYIASFLASADGLLIAKSFLRITKPELRRLVSNLVEQLCED